MTIWPRYLKKKKVGPFSENKAMSLHFALGKCYDDIKNYEKAFPHFLAGCKLKRSKTFLYSRRCR